MDVFKELQSTKCFCSYNQRANRDVPTGGRKRGVASPQYLQIRKNVGQKAAMLLQYSAAQKVKKVQYWIFRT